MFEENSKEASYDLDQIKDDDMSEKEDKSEKKMECDKPSSSEKTNKSDEIANKAHKEVQNSIVSTSELLSKSLAIELLNCLNKNIGFKAKFHNEEKSSSSSELEDVSGPIKRKRIRSRNRENGDFGDYDDTKKMKKSIQIRKLSDFDSDSELSLSLDRSKKEIKNKNEIDEENQVCF